MEQNKKALMIKDDEIEEVKRKGDALVLENDNCEGEYLYSVDLKKIVDDAGIKLNFVVLGACHSETAVNIFLEAGAEHVIGI